MMKQCRGFVKLGFLVAIAAYLIISMIAFKFYSTMKIHTVLRAQIRNFDLLTETDPGGGMLSLNENITILMWTEYYHNKDLTDHIKNESPIPEWCNVTFDRRQLNNSEAVVFHIPGRDLDLNDLPPRDLDQLWVFFIIEPPVYMARDSAPLNGLFNRTMSYRLDSDYPCPYGYLTKKPKPISRAELVASPEFPKNKSLPVAWMVSHCGTTSGREYLVNKLKLHIPIDVYGSCGTLRCNKKDEEGCYRKLGLTYKFYLAFENSLCTDYITEKFSNALRYYMVPVVYGKGNYSAIAPHPKSFINVADFSSAAALAKYLNYLDGNATAYAEYHEWRRYYDIHIRQGFAGFRRMCQALQQNDQQNKVYEDIPGWWFKGQCIRRLPNVNLYE